MQLYEEQKQNRSPSPSNIMLKSQTQKLPPRSAMSDLIEKMPLALVCLVSDREEFIFRMCVNGARSFTAIISLFFISFNFTTLFFFKTFIEHSEFYNNGNVSKMFLEHIFVIWDCILSAWCLQIFMKV